MDLVFNEKQTPIDDEKLNSLPQEVRDDFLTSINNVLFINRLISPERKHAKDLERDSEGRIKVDLTNPHILENMDYFRQAAIHYKKYGCYTNLRPNPNPNSEYMKWATEEIRRCWYGMVRPDDGEWIPGDLYFYWNYCPIIQTRVKEGSRKGDRIIDFPEPWDSTYFWAHYNYQAVYGGPFNDYRGGNHFFVIARRGVGKAHPYTEQVYTPEGLRSWGDLQIGDFVFGDDGKPTKITHIPFDGIIDTYKVTLRDGRTVLCSDEHLWNVMIHNRKGIHTLSTKKLLQIYKRERKKSDHNPNGVEYVCSIPKNGCVDFEYKQTQIDPYTFGLLLGDGTFRGTSFYLTMLPKDFNELREYIPYECTSQPADDMNHKIHINGLSYILKDYSLINKKSEDKFIPDEYKFNSRDVRLNILHGLIDTDGFVLKKHNCYYISTASKQLADDIVWISRSLGFNASVTVKNTKYFNKKTNQYVNCLPSWTVSIYSDCKLGKLERKTAKQYKSAYSKSRFDKTRIVNIEYVGKMQSKCITVSNDTGCYLIDDFVVTHNSYYLASNLAKVFILGESKDVSESVKGTIVAADKTYLIEDGTLNKFERYIDFLAENTEWPAQRLTGRLDDMYWEMGYRDNASPAKQGTGNVIVGLSVKDKPGKVRGKRAVRTYFEEVGSFPNLIDTYNTARYNAEEGDISFGTLGLIGCVCAGTKVFDKNFNEINIEDLKQEDGIIGFDINNDCYSVEPITYMQDLCYKECVEIKTRKRTLRCSIDHPILTRIKHTKRNVSYKVGDTRDSWFTYEFVPAEYFLKHKDNFIVIADGSPMNFGNEQLQDAYLTGLLIGDGSYGYDKTPRLSNCDEDILNYVEQKYDCVIERKYLTKTNKIYKEIRIKNICQMLRDCGIYGQTKSAKRLPNNYLNLDQKNASEIIAGFFDTDGTIGDGCLIITSGVFELLQQTQELLKLFGIRTTIGKTKARICDTRKDKNDWYNLKICGRNNILKFQKYIPIKVKHKIEKINNYCERAKSFYKFTDNTLVEKVIDVKPIGVQRIYNLTANKTHTYVANGIITHNTGGEKGQNFAGALEMIYNPRGYGFYPLPNVFDKTANGGEVVLFLGAYLNRKLHYDKNGNSDVTGALLEVLTERFNIKNTSTDPATLTQKKAELPITIQDCVMKVDGNFYPVADLNERLNQIAADTSVLRDVFVGKLNMVGGHVEFQPTDDKPIREFPHKDNKKEGAIEIYKMPEINKVTGKVFNNRYIAGIDTYDNDVANSVSLGSILVLDSFTDQIVCEYTGRPLFADDFYEVCRRICLFYNCKANYEQNKKGLYSYFSRTHSTYLLTETFQYLRDKDLVKGESFGNTAYGTTATQPIKNYARGLIRNWLLKPCIKYEHKDGEDIEISYPQLYNLKNVALIKELSMYDLENNFDRHDALSMLMLYREDVYRLNSGAPKARDDEEGDFTKDEFFQTFEKRKQPKNPKWLIE